MSNTNKAVKGTTKKTGSLGSNADANVLPDTYEVESIEGKKIENGVSYYFIKWKDYGHEVNTWEPSSHLVQCFDMVIEYELQLTAGKACSSSGSGTGGESSVNVNKNRTAMNAEIRKGAGASTSATSTSEAATTDDANTPMNIDEDSASSSSDGTVSSDDNTSNATTVELDGANIVTKVAAADAKAAVELAGTDDDAESWESDTDDDDNMETGADESSREIIVDVLEQLPEGKVPLEMLSIVPVEGLMTYVIQWKTENDDDIDISMIKGDVFRLAYPEIVIAYYEQNISFLVRRDPVQPAAAPSPPPSDPEPDTDQESSVSEGEGSVASIASSSATETLRSDNAGSDSSDTDSQIEYNNFRDGVIAHDQDEQLPGPGNNVREE